MSANIPSIPEEKNNLHPRNKHRQRYNFPELIAASPELAGYVAPNLYGDLSVDFKKPQAVKSLNRALLQFFYKVDLWDIPEGYLCPPIPGRADYIHYVADLLGADNKNVIPLGKTIKVLDIGVGANCIYPLIGHHEYGWNFVGSDIDHIAVNSAKNIVEANGLNKAISIRKQNSSTDMFHGVIKPGEMFDATICNPPFHTSMREAIEGTSRKWKNLGHKQPSAALNFGGKNSELWCDGGEERFVRRMIEESAQFAHSCRWFTSLISKKETLEGCYRTLNKIKATEVKVIRMSQGQKNSRVLAWTFNN